MSFSEVFPFYAKKKKEKYAGLAEISQFFLLSSRLDSYGRTGHKCPEY